MSESDQEQSSPEPLSPRTAVVRAGLRRNYSSSNIESKGYKSEGSSKMAEIPNNNNVEGGGALVVQPRNLREFSIPKVTDQPLCIVYPQLTIDRNSFRLKRLTRLERKFLVSHKEKEKLFMNVGRGLLDSERMMVDATSGEGLMNKTADEAFTLFESLSANSQQWSHNKGRGAPMKDVVSEVVTGPLGNKVEVQDQSFAEHMLEQANALQARNPNNDPYSNMYNPGWRNHPNFKWSNNSNVQQSQGPPPGFQIQQRQFQQAPQQVQEQRGDQIGELQDMFKKFIGQQMQTN
ncbi:unnamed protein product [Prunus armeniaca]